MSLDVCLFACVGVPRDVLEARLQALAAFYAPLGARGGRLWSYPHLGLTFGAICMGVSEVPDEDAASDIALTFGRVPAGLRTSRGVLDASDEEMRALSEFGLVMACDGQRARIVTPACEMAGLYSSGECWATHAVAASWMAYGNAAVDATPIPSLLEFGFTGSDRTLIKGATAVAAATVIDLPASVRSRSYWPAVQRYAPLTEAESVEAATQALDRAAGLLQGSDAVLGLTAGLDSLVVAVAMQRASVDFSAFTWGDAAYGEPAAAERARAINVPHRFVSFGLDATEDDGFAFLDAQARWSEGAARLSARGIPRMPTMDPWVTGAGGETGRAYWYRWHALERPQPTIDHVSRSLAGDRPAAEFDVQAWLADGQQLGYDGWRLLDVAYARQRLRHWGRAMIPCQPFDISAPLTNPHVQQALVSLPLTLRVSDGFGRQYVALRRPDLVPAGPPVPRPGIPRPLRRVASALRQRRQPPATVHAPLQRARERTWLADTVLADDLITGAMGTAWALATRQGLLAGHDRATEQAQLAAGPVTLAAALADLRT